MSEFYHKGKRYAANESELLCEAKYTNGTPRYRLYRTKKGAYLMVHYSDTGRRVAIVSEEKARRFMDYYPDGIRRGYYDAIFGRPEKG